MLRRIGLELYPKNSGKLTKNCARARYLYSIIVVENRYRDYGQPGLINLFATVTLVLCQDKKINYLWIFLNISALKSLVET
jgi:hypothetical protein